MTICRKNKLFFPRVLTRRIKGTSRISGVVKPPFMPFFPLLFFLLPLFFFLFREHQWADEDAVEDHADNEKPDSADKSPIGEGESRDSFPERCDMITEAKMKRCHKSHYDPKDAENKPFHVFQPLVFALSALLRKFVW